MASTFKNLNQEDVSNIKTMLYENIPITGTIVSGTYISSGNETNVYNYTHGMFQTVYDYPYASSSANNLFDITIGHSSLSPSYGTSNNFNSKKTNIYNQLAKVLVGYDYTGSILKFDQDGDFTTTTDKLNSLFFLTFSRLLVKDEIKKGSFSMVVGLNNSTKSAIFGVTGTIADTGGDTTYKINSPVGEYAPLYLTETGGNYPNTNKQVGLIFYQAGIVALSTGLFAASGSGSPATSMSSSTVGQLANAATIYTTTGSYTNIQHLFTSGTIVNACDALRTHVGNINFKNTTELNSTIYFLRVNNNEFNYSSNPTYLTGSRIRVKGQFPGNAAVSYITTAGLYSSDNELLAVAKLSEPLKKTEEQSLLLRVRLDY